VRNQTPARSRALGAVLVVVLGAPTRGRGPGASTPLCTPRRWRSRPASCVCCWRTRNGGRVPGGGMSIDRRPFRPDGPRRRGGRSEPDPRPSVMGRPPAGRDWYDRWHAVRAAAVRLEFLEHPPGDLAPPVASLLASHRGDRCRRSCSPASRTSPSTTRSRGPRWPGLHPGDTSSGVPSRPRCHSARRTRRSTSVSAICARQPR